MRDFLQRIAKRNSIFVRISRKTCDFRQKISGKKCGIRQRMVAKRSIISRKSEKRIRHMVTMCRESESIVDDNKFQKTETYYNKFLNRQTGVCCKCDNIKKG